MSAEWSKSGPDVSGRALSGRITRTAFSAKEDLTSRVSMALSCSAIRDDVAERKQARENDCTMVNKIKRSVRASTGPVNWLLSIMMNKTIRLMSAFMEQVQRLSSMMDEMKKCLLVNYFKVYCFGFSLGLILFLWSAVEKLNRRLDDVDEQLKAIVKRTPADGAYDTSSGEEENVETSVDDPPNPPEMNGTDEFVSEEGVKTLTSSCKATSSVPIVGTPVGKGNFRYNLRSGIDESGT